MNPMENIVGNQMQKTSFDKSLLDKLFAKDEIEKITAIHKKTTPTREDMQELKQLLTGMEVKLLNFDQDYPHILGRYLVRIIETFSYYESMEELYSRIKPFLTEARTKELFSTMIYTLKATCLFYSSNFQWIERSTMSIEGSGFFNALTNKFELSYPQMGGVQQQQNQGLLGGVFKR